MSKQKIAILGAGNLGTALALHLASAGHDLFMYCVEPRVERQINRKHCNKKYLPNRMLPSNIRASSDLEWVLADASAVFLAVPSHVAMEVIQDAAPFLSRKADLLIASKGLDPKTLKPIGLACAEHLPSFMRKRVCLFGGPFVASEVGAPAGIVIAGKDSSSRNRLKKLMTHNAVVTTDTADILGVGYCSALKNAYAIALGMCQGIGCPANTNALLFTASLHEMERLVRAGGGHPETVHTLAGIGDLYATGLSAHGHNRCYGELLARRRTSNPKRLGLTSVEGIAATDTGIALAKKYRQSTPLLSAIRNGIKSKRDFTKPLIRYLRTASF